MDRHLVFRVWLSSMLFFAVNPWTSVNGSDECEIVQEYLNNVKKYSRIYHPQAVPYDQVLNLTTEVAHTCLLNETINRRSLLGTYSKASYSRVATEYDYADVLRKSLYFYECQRSGDLPDYCPVTNDPSYSGTTCTRPRWRKDSALQDASYSDGRTKSPDLTGGYYDAGDHNKFGLPLAFALGHIGLGMLAFPEGYAMAGQTQHGLAALRWGFDYLIKAHSSSDTTRLAAQVGNPPADHAFCCRPEEMTMPRPAYFIDSTKPGTDLWGATAAALAAGVTIFRNAGDTTYANTLLTHAKQLYNAAKNNPKVLYHVSVPAASNYYRSYSWADDMSYAAGLLYWVTKDVTYLNDAKTFFNSAGTWPSWDWDNNQWGAAYIINKFDPSYQRAKTVVNEFLNYWHNQATYTPKGLAWFTDWGALRAASGAAMMSMLWANAPETQGDENRQAKLYCWALTQIQYILGDGGRSFVVGFGTNPPRSPHHRSSTCEMTGTCNYNNFDGPAPNAQTLFGGLVGGPDKFDAFADNRKDYKSAEVALDFQSGFQGAIAGLLQRRPQWTTTCQCLLTSTSPNSCPLQWISNVAPASPTPPPSPSPSPVPPSPTPSPSPVPPSPKPSPSPVPPSPKPSPSPVPPSPTPSPSPVPPSPKPSPSPMPPSPTPSPSPVPPSPTPSPSPVPPSPTPSPSPSPTPPPSTTPPSPSPDRILGAPSCPQVRTPTSVVVPMWRQCGGRGSRCTGEQCLYDAPWRNHVCANGGVCCRQGQWYYQCKPRTTVCRQCAASTPPPSPILSTGSTIIPVWGQCGGRGGPCAPYNCPPTQWPNTVCASGSTCIKSDDWYWQCRL